MKLPKSKPRRWWRTERTKALITSFPPLAGSLVTAFTITREMPTWVSATAWVASAWLLVATVFAIYVAAHADKEKEADTTPRDLAGCLHTLHALLVHHKQLPNAKRSSVRMTIHAVEGETMEQIVDYVGGTGGATGRKFSSRSGIVGRAVTTKEFLVAHRAERQSQGDYIKEMQSIWHMPKGEAEQLMHDRQSFIAMPILGKGDEVVGVLFADTSIASFFDRATEELMLEGHRGICEYIKDRYGG